MQMEFIRSGRLYPIENRRFFLQTFDFDENAPEQAVTQQPTLTAECIIFARTLEQLDKPANFFISRECHKKYCRNPYEWFDIVRDIPGEDYTICTEQYQPPDPLWKNGNGITDRDAHIAIELRCKHIICLPCFLNWIWSGMQNYNMWPLCRADLRPPNPAPEWKEEFAKDIAGLGIHASASDMLQSLNSYIAKLPEGVQSIELPDIEEVGQAHLTD
jgi:hypothetical protein